MAGWKRKEKWLTGSLPADVFNSHYTRKVITKNRDDETQYLKKIPGLGAGERAKMQLQNCAGATGVEV